MSELVVRLERAVPAWLARDVESRLAYIDEAVVSGSLIDERRAVRVRLCADAATGEPDVARIGRRVARLVATLSGGIEPRTRVVEAQRTRPGGCGCDVDELLTGQHQLHRELAGVYVLGPQLARLVDALDRKLGSITERLGARPFRFPALIDPALLERLSAFQYFPHTLGFAGHLRRDLDVLEAFSSRARTESQGVVAAEGSFAPPKALLTPAVCYHLYGYLSGRVLDDAPLVATALGQCFRHEASNMASLERLWEFTVREIVFVGTPRFVLESRERVQAMAREIFAELRLDHHVETAHDHFFGAELPRQSVLQTAFELKLEVRASLPPRAATLAVASYNYHQDFFGRRMAIALPDGSVAHTACVGFGLERLAYALVAQHGVDPERWPGELQRALA